MGGGGGGGAALRRSGTFKDARQGPVDAPYVDQVLCLWREAAATMYSRSCENVTAWRGGGFQGGGGRRGHSGLVGANKGISHRPLRLSPALQGLVLPQGEKCRSASHLPLHFFHGILEGKPERQEPVLPHQRPLGSAAVAGGGKGSTHATCEPCLLRRGPGKERGGVAGWGGWGGSRQKRRRREKREKRLQGRRGRERCGREESGTLCMACLLPGRERRRRLERSDGFVGEIEKRRMTRSWLLTQEAPAPSWRPPDPGWKRCHRP